MNRILRTLAITLVLLVSGATVKMGGDQPVQAAGPLPQLCPVCPACPPCDGFTLNR